MISFTGIILLFFRSLLSSSNRSPSPHLFLKISNRSRWQELNVSQQTQSKITIFAFCPALGWDNFISIKSWNEEKYKERPVVKILLFRTRIRLTNIWTLGPLLRLYPPLLQSQTVKYKQTGRLQRDKLDLKLICSLLRRQERPRVNQSIITQGKHFWRRDLEMKGKLCAKR